MCTIWKCGMILKLNISEEHMEQTIRKGRLEWFLNVYTLNEWRRLLMRLSFWVNYMRLVAYCDHHLNNVVLVLS
ncbi:hypothetical protein AQUCO_03200049v1 [Aquilegia coerulea]|uniref:Uncharacterized protein n=1 Tax=Aquilegia coerulea TaxID=218851 RepID=A0A2G5D0U7_AQUCA|nr:hypothetical protein AQUCO_03200049v1 [Aquilegia coerulea]